MAVVTTRQLLDAGVHFGHQTRRWNPKMKRFIFTERNGIYIIDLQKSALYIDAAYAFVKDIVAKGGQILFVGTKKQAQESIAEQATRVGMPFVNQRWLGGMLTNFATIAKRISKMKELEGINFDNVAASGMTKKELLQQKRKKDKLAKTLSGIRDMGRLPQAIWVVDTKKEHLAIDEARKLGIPIVGILDTNCDPDEVDFAIPGNDDAIRSVGLLTRVIADAVADGLLARSQAAEATGEEAEPMPEWEAELLGTPEAAPVGDDAAGQVAAPVAEAASEAPAEAAPQPAETPVAAAGQAAPAAAVPEPVEAVVAETKPAEVVAEPVEATAAETVKELAADEAEPAKEESRAKRAPAKKAQPKAEAAAKPEPKPAPAAKAEAPAEAAADAEAVAQGEAAVKPSAPAKPKATKAELDEAKAAADQVAADVAKIAAEVVNEPEVKEILEQAQEVSEAVEAAAEGKAE